MAERRALLTGTSVQGALERSYAAAFRDAGFHVHIFDIFAAVNRYCRGGRVGRMFNTFVPVEPWLRKANRELVLTCRDIGPDVMVVFGQSPVHAGSLAQIRCMLPELRVLQVWPDTLVNLSAGSIATLPLFDLVATYSKATAPYFEKLGARRVAWVPLAADPHMHKAPSGGLSIAERRSFEAEVAFVGQWRPEREAALEVVLRALPERDVKVWGPSWDRSRAASKIRRAWQGRALYEIDLAKVHFAAAISLNIIDPTNYPAANMRFFEIPVAGGLQVCSACPEIEGEFRDGETVFYYHSLDQLPVLVQELLNDEPRRQSVAQAGKELVLGRHTYLHRVERIMELLGVERP